MNRDYLLFFILSIVVIGMIYIMTQTEGFLDDRYNRFQVDARLTPSRFLVSADAPKKVGV
jgi:hypothetical protein